MLRQAAEESVQSHQAVVEQLRAGLAAAEEAAQKQLEELFSCQAETEQLRAAVDEMSGSCLQQLGLGEKLLELMDEVEHAQVPAHVSMCMRSSVLMLSLASKTKAARPGIPGKSYTASYSQTILLFIHC